MEFQKREYTPEEKKEYAQKKQKEAKTYVRLCNYTTKKIAASPQNFEEYLQLQSRFPTQSARNTILIYAQNPNAKKIKTFDNWKKEVDANGKPLYIRDAFTKYIVVFTRGTPKEYVRSDGTTGKWTDYNVPVHMIDISQKNAPPIVPPTLDKNPEKLVEYMCAASPVNVRIIDNDTENNNKVAYYDNNNGTIYVYKSQSEATSIAQYLSRELGYVQLALTGNEAYDRDRLTFGANCIGYMLCLKYSVSTLNAYGIPFFSINLLPDLYKSADERTIRQDLEKYRKCFVDLCHRIDVAKYKYEEQ